MCQTRWLFANWPVSRAQPLKNEFWKKLGSKIPDIPKFNVITIKEMNRSYSFKNYQKSCFNVEIIMKNDNCNNYKNIIQHNLYWHYSGTSYNVDVVWCNLVQRWELFNAVQSMVYEAKLYEVLLYNVVGTRYYCTVSYNVVR